MAALTYHQRGPEFHASTLESLMQSITFKAGRAAMIGRTIDQIRAKHQGDFVGCLSNASVFKFATDVAPRMRITQVHRPQSSPKANKSSIF